MRIADLLRIAVLAPGLLLTGCLYISIDGGFGPVLDPEVVGAIVPGETTKGRVLELLGPPAEYVRSEVLGALGDESSRVSGAVALGNRAQDAFTYQRDVVGGNGSMLIVWHRLRIDAESDLLVIFFDEGDVVRDLSLRRVPTR